LLCTTPAYSTKLDEAVCYPGKLHSSIYLGTADKLPFESVFSLKIFLPHMISHCVATYSVREAKYNFNSCPNNSNTLTHTHTHTNFIIQSHPLSSSDITTPFLLPRLGKSYVAAINWLTKYKRLSNVISSVDFLQPSRYGSLSCAIRL
jgi:hypothetical protein